MSLFLLLSGLSACDSADERAESHMKRGLEFAEAGELTKASLEFRNALRLDDTLSQAWLGMARISFDSQNYQGAYNQFVRVTELDEDNLEARSRLAQLLLSANQLDEAFRQIELAYKLGPDDPNVLTIRAGVAFQLKNYELAVSSARRALEIEPVYPRAGSILVIERIEAGEFEDALQIVSEHLEKSPGFESLHVLKYQILARLDDDRGVVGQLDKMIGLFPEQKNHRKALLEWHRAKGRNEEVERILRDTVASEPASTEAGFELYNFILSDGDRAGARAELEALADGAAEASAAFVYLSALGVHDYQAGDTESARRVLRQAVELDVSEADKRSGRLKLAELDLLEGDLESALSEVTSVLEEDMQHPDALAMKGLIYSNRGDHSTAVQAIRSALGQAGRDPQLLRTAARIYDDAGESTLALETLASALPESNYETGLILDYVNMLARFGRTRAIEITLTEALRRRNFDRRLIGRLAQARLDLGDLSGAEEIARLLQNSDNATGLASRILAATSGARGQFERSLEILLTSREQGDRSAENLRAIVSAFVRNENLSGAKHFLSEHIEENSNDVQAKLLLSSIEAMFGNAQETEKILVELIAARPDAPEAYLGYGRFLSGMDRRKEAIDLLNAGLEELPEENRDDLAFMLGQIHESEGNISQAYEIYSELYARNPDSLLLANNLASIAGDYLANEPGIVDRMLVVTSRLKDVDIPQFQDTYGWTLHLAGKHDEALRALLRAIEAFPDHPTVNYHIGSTYLALNLPERALEHLEKSAASLADDAPYRSKVEKALEDIKAGAQQEQN